MPSVLTVSECEEQLFLAHAALLVALHDGDQAAADKAYALRDDLLDRYPHCARPKQPA